MNQAKWLSVKEAALLLGGVSTNVIYRLYHAGELPGMRVASCVKLQLQGVEKYMQEHTNGGGPPPRRPEKAKSATSRIDPERLKRLYA